VAPPSRDGGDELNAQLRERFEETYARRYGFAAPGEVIEATTWRLTVLGESTLVTLPRFETRDGTPSPAGARPAYFPECEGFCETPVFDRYTLFAGQELQGPAIVEERESTTVLPPGTTATVDEHGTLLVSL
jgi:N-methylhydantoinase A/oxoprolinase/acetone carboxylase beta subunit